MTGDEVSLDTESTAAIEALVEAGFDPARVPAARRDQAQKIADLLATLHAGSFEPDPALTDVIMARIERSAEPVFPELTPADHAALEALVMHGFEPSRVPNALRPRAERHRALADLVSGGASIGADGLVDRTLAAVQRQIDQEADRMRLESRRGSWASMRLADVLSVAAMLLIGVAIVWPLVTSLRESQQQALCFSRVGAMAGAFGSYAMSAADALPVAAGSVAEGVWWDVGREGRSNSANLFLLAPTGFLTVGDMACPGNPEARTADATPGERDWSSFDEVSFSYQHADTASANTWRTGRFVVLADRSPITVLNRQGQPAPAEANSLNHRQAGQRVLMSDGSAQWLTSPLVDGDNIWLPELVERVIDNMRTGAPLLHGLEKPASPSDAMLVP
ncbi:MAG: hypothetical protein ACF8R7_08150 [Phycisphaerales bacterium JB039]